MEKTMLRTLRFAGLMAFVFVPLTLGAQVVEDDRPVQFGISAGLTFPMGDVSDAFSSGFNVAGHAFMRPAALGNLSFRGDVSLDRFSAKKSISLTNTAQDGSFTAIGVVANGVYNFSQVDPDATMRPYALVGVGFWHTRSSITTSVSSSTSTVESNDTNAGVQLGAGVNIHLGTLAAFGEAKLVNVFGDGSTARWFPISFGLRF
jgi:opacity protein-like surface antigen